MGMFDSLYDDAGDEWQTKAYDLRLDMFRVGDEMPETSSGLRDYQVAILGGGEYRKPFMDSLATVREGRLVSINDERDASLPELDYWGARIERSES